jgi:hypothetical protein
MCDWISQVTTRIVSALSAVPKVNPIKHSEKKKAEESARVE